MGSRSRDRGGGECWGPGGRTFVTPLRYTNCSFFFLRLPTNPTASGEFSFLPGGLLVQSSPGGSPAIPKVALRVHRGQSALHAQLPPESTSAAHRRPYPPVDSTDNPQPRVHGTHNDRKSASMPQFGPGRPH